MIGNDVIRVHVVDVYAAIGSANICLVGGVLIEDCIILDESTRRLAALSGNTLRSQIPAPARL